MKPRTIAATLSRVSRARQFPANTDPAARHAELIGRALVRRQPYPMLQEEPEHCGLSILEAVASVYRLRTALGVLHRVCLAMDAKREADRPSEREYQTAMRAAARLGGAAP